MALQLVEAAVQMLRDTRGRPDPALNAALATCFGKHASLFATPPVIEVGPIGLLSLPHSNTACLSVTACDPMHAVWGHPVPVSTV